MSVYTPAKSDARLFLAEMDADGVLTPIFQLSEDTMTQTSYTPAKSDSRKFAAVVDVDGNLTPLIKIEGATSSKRWVGYVSQVGSNAPTIDYVLVNTLGVDLTTQYNSPGAYQIHAPSPVFTENKTTPGVGYQEAWQINSFDGNTTLYFLRVGWVDETTIGLEFGAADFASPPIVPNSIDLGFSAVIVIEVFP